MLRAKPIAFLCGALFFSQTVHAQPAEPDFWPAVIAKSPDGFVNLITKYRQQNEEFIQHLIALVNLDPDAQSVDNDERLRVKLAREEAVYFLGELRTAKAVPCLVQHLTEIKASIIHGRNMDRDIGRLPCALALVDIGKPAVEEIIWRLERSHGEKDNEGDVATIAIVLDKILGRAGAVKTLNNSLQTQRKVASGSNSEEQDVIDYSKENVTILTQALHVLEQRPE